MSNVRFSQLPTVVALKDNDIFAISSPDTATPPVYTSAQAPISQVAAKIVEDTTFTTSLNTTNKTVAGAINETLSNFANEYSASSTYAVGDCVLYAGSIYQCTTAIPSGEAWDSTHWTQIKAVDVGSGSSGGHNYSTDEQVVGTWVDGSTVYEKTVYDAGGVRGNFDIPHNVSNLDRVISYSGTVKDTAFSTYHDIWSIPRLDTIMVGIDRFTTTAVKVVNPTQFDTRLVDWYITFRYTKSSS